MANTKKASSSAKSTNEDEASETEVKQLSATGESARPSTIGGPTQDDLNPAYAPSKEDEQKVKKEKDDGENQ